MGYPKFNKAIVTVVAELEIREGKEMAVGGLSNGHLMVHLESQKQVGVPELNSRLGIFFATD